jgi:hypothetical protein
MIHAGGLKGLLGLTQAFFKKKYNFFFYFHPLTLGLLGIEFHNSF